MTDQKEKIEFVMHTEKYLEIRYFDEGKKKRYLCWSLPSPVVDELVRWWTEKKDKEKVKGS